MTSESASAAAHSCGRPCSPRADHSLLREFVCRAAILFLLFGLAGLSAVAKDSIYVPRRCSTHFINIASKMNVAQSQAVVDREPPSRLAGIVPPLRVVRVRRPEERQAPAISPGVSFSLRHRSPPPLLS